MFPIGPAMCCRLASLLGDKLTQCLESGPTDRPQRLRFASLPTGTGRGRRWSAQLHLAPLWSLQNLVIIKTKAAFTGWLLILFQCFEIDFHLRYGV